ncbi:MAG: alkaline phosphatase, partial [Mariniblastus sp.]
MCFVRARIVLSLLVIGVLYSAAACVAQQPDDFLRSFQFRAVELNQSDWIHWGDRQGTFSNWTSHSNRLIPVYSFGVSLESVSGENSAYRSDERLADMFGAVPAGTLNPAAEYFDQTDIYRVQKQAWLDGKRNIILMVFDGMDWNTTRAASIYKNRKVLYSEGRGTGLAFQDYQGGNSEFGFCVTSPRSGSSKVDVDSQTVNSYNERSGGYSSEFGGKTPWSNPGDASYLLGRRKALQHPYTDSASSATSLCTGMKTFNGSIGVGVDSQQFLSLAHQMQRQGSAVGVVTSVPISHATPASFYANNVTRNDYQDLTRDLLGLNSAAHREKPLAGVDVLIGGGWGETVEDDRVKQGMNFVPGNKYVAAADLAKVDHSNGGKYVVAQRTAGVRGDQALQVGVQAALKHKKRLFGFFGGPEGHLPYQTADGDYFPTRGKKKIEVYSKADVSENPTLAQMTDAALTVLSQNQTGFYLMVECGDVDWGLHNNNIDDAVGAALSGEAAFERITAWVEANSNWEETCLIVTSDHGHLMCLDDPSVLTGNRMPMSDQEFARLLEAKRIADAEQKRLEEAKAKAAAEAKA